MWALFLQAFRVASIFGLGATVQNWFFDKDEPQDTSSFAGIVRAFMPLLITGAIIVAIYKFLGKKIRIG